MPLYFRLPKRGFTNPFRKFYNVINIDALDQFEAGAVVDQASLAAKGLLRDASLPIKLLGRGSLNKKLDITVDKASSSARDAVAKAGGQLNLSESGKKS